ncbi:hypothetical protein F5Y16DRAFT_266729 [Xylariaceae sp. FL0255]|nr:hypothetical protein F5Y16DRAFT_266729 [Xylariaceae sp. FL0255]
MCGFLPSSDDKNPSGGCLNRVQSKAASIFPRRRSSAAERPSSSDQQQQTPYVPQHAGSSFLRTATPRAMKQANEVLRRRKYQGHLRLALPTYHFDPPTLIRHPLIIWLAIPAQTLQSAVPASKWVFCICTRAPHVICIVPA